MYTNRFFVQEKEKMLTPLERKALLKHTIPKVFEEHSTGGLYYHAQGSLSRTLQYLNQFATKDPSCFWMSDEGYLYPLALTRHCAIPFSRFLLIKTNSVQETWKLSLEAIHTGLFEVALIRPSKSCDTSHWRRLQLASEKMKVRVFFIGKFGIPHWVLKNETENDTNRDSRETRNETNFILPKPQLTGSLRGSLPFAYTSNLSF